MMATRTTVRRAAAVLLRGNSTSSTSSSSHRRRRPSFAPQQHSTFCAAEKKNNNAGDVAATNDRSSSRNGSSKESEGALANVSATAPSSSSSSSPNAEERRAAASSMDECKYEGGSVSYYTFDEAMVKLRRLARPLPHWRARRPNGRYLEVNGPKEDAMVAVEILESLGLRASKSCCASAILTAHGRMDSAAAERIAGFLSRQPTRVRVDDFGFRTKEDLVSLFEEQGCAVDRCYIQTRRNVAEEMGFAYLYLKPDHLVQQAVAALDNHESMKVRISLDNPRLNSWIWDQCVQAGYSERDEESWVRCMRILTLSNGAVGHVGLRVGMLACAHHGKMDEALELASESLSRGDAHDGDYWGLHLAMRSFCWKLHHVRDDGECHRVCQKVIAFMRQKKIPIDAHVYDRAMSAAGNLRDWDEVLRLWDQLRADNDATNNNYQVSREEQQLRLRQTQQTLAASTIVLRRQRSRNEATAALVRNLEAAKNRKRATTSAPASLTDEEKEAARAAAVRCMAPRDDGRCAVQRIHALQRVGRWDEALEAMKAAARSYADHREVLKRFYVDAALGLTSPGLHRHEALRIGMEALNTFARSVWYFSDAQLPSFELVLPRGTYDEYLRRDATRALGLIDETDETHLRFRIPPFRERRRSMAEDDGLVWPDRVLVPLAHAAEVALHRALLFGEGAASVETCRVLLAVVGDTQKLAERFNKLDARFVTAITEAGRRHDIHKAEGLYELLGELKKAPLEVVGAVMDAKCRMARRMLSHYRFFATTDQQRVACMAKHDELLQDALELFRASPEPSAHYFSIITRALARAPDRHAEALEVHERARSLKMSTLSETASYEVVSALARNSHLDTAMLLARSCVAEEHRTISDDSLRLIYLDCRKADREEHGGADLALEIFPEYVFTRNEANYSPLMLNLLQHFQDDWKGAIEALVEALDVEDEAKKVKPSRDEFQVVLEACERAEVWGDALDVLELMRTVTGAQGSSNNNKNKNNKDYYDDDRDDDF